MGGSLLPTHLEEANDDEDLRTIAGLLMVSWWVVPPCVIDPQVCTACANSFAHGSNEVANAIGPLAAIYQVNPEA